MASREPHLIPLLALGVPGDVITAIIMGAFMIHGLQPGPMMFILNVDIIYGLFIGLIVSSVFLFFIGSVAIRGFKYVADIPRGVLFPAVLVLCVYGVFAVNNNIFDVGVMFAMGAVGFVMLRYKVPAAPFLIAFILGPLLEGQFPPVHADVRQFRVGAVSRPHNLVLLDAHRHHRLRDCPRRDQGYPATIRPHCLALIEGIFHERC